METGIVYCDETGDDGLNTKSSDAFILTSVYMPASSWMSNYRIVRNLRRELKNQFGFPAGCEMHTKNFMTDKNPYRDFHWTGEEKRKILMRYTEMIASLNLKVVNVIIDKTAIHSDEYNILAAALTYNIQSIENDCRGEWNYIFISDKGRIAPMRKAARAIRADYSASSVEEHFTGRSGENMIEDILEKDSEESHFIQICDFISFFVHLYYSGQYSGKNLPNRVQNLIDPAFVRQVLLVFRNGGILNTDAGCNEFGFVIEPRRA